MTGEIDVNAASRWLAGVLVPASLAAGCARGGADPPVVDSAEELPSAIAWALGDSCRFEPLFPGGLGGCACGHAVGPGLPFGMPGCDPPPVTGSREFERLQALFPAMKRYAVGDSKAAALARAVWILSWSDEPLDAERALREVEIAGFGRPSSPEDLADLTALRLVRGVRASDAEELFRALDSAEQAAASGDGSIQVAWNRALASKHAGLRTEAIEQWGDLAANLPQKLRGAAQRHLMESKRSVAPDAWAKCDFDLERELECASTTVAEAVRSNPQRAREWTEEEVLGRWGELVLAGERDSAAPLLDFATEIGRALSADQGEELLRSASDHLRGLESEELQEAARALVSYRDAQRAFRSFEIDRADRGYRAAEAGFRACGNPLRVRAVLGMVVRDYQAGRFDEMEATADLAATLANRVKSPAALARLDWVRGTLDGALGGEILQDVAWARAIQRLLDTDSYEDAGSLSSLRGVVQIQLGARSRGARSTLDSLRLVPRFSSPSRRVQVFLFAGFALRELGDLAGAAAMLRQATGLARASGRALDEVYALIDTAAVLAAQGLGSGARELLKAARAAVAGVEMREVRSYVEGELEIVESESWLREDPKKVLQAVDLAWAKFESVREVEKLHRLRLIRAEALRALGRGREAFADLRENLASEVQERASTSVRRESLRARIEQLYENLIPIAHSDLGDNGLALDLVLERLSWRGGDLTGTRSLAFFRGGASSLQRMLRPGELAVVFEANEEALWRWSVSASAVEFNELQMSPRHLRQLSEADWMAGPDRSARADLASSGVGGGILPDGAGERSDRALFLILDPTLSEVDFERFAPASSGTPLASLRPVVRLEAWRARAGVASSKSARREGAEPLVVLAADPAFDADRFPGIPRLPGARAEALALRAEYPSAELLVGEGANPAALLSAAVRSDLLVISAHALTGRGASRHGILLMAPDERREDDGVVTFDEIAALALRRHPAVVLAGCSTARGESEGGAGTESLASAFLGAGAAAVVATLEDVDDRAASVLSARLISRSRGLSREVREHDQLEWAIELARVVGSEETAELPFVVVASGSYPDDAVGSAIP